MSKPVIATASLAGCFGCHMSILDIDDRILKLVELIDFDKSPIDDIKKFTGRCAIGLIEGGCCNEENVRVLKDFRKHCDILISVGECAICGGIPAMRNLVGTDEALKRAYLDTETTVGGFIPNSPELGKPLDTVVGVDKVVKVDLFIPGCPPRADAFFYALSEILAGRTPVILPPEYFTYD